MDKVLHLFVFGLIQFIWMGYFSLSRFRTLVGIFVLLIPTLAAFSIIKDVSMGLWLHGDYQYTGTGWYDHIFGMNPFWVYTGMRLAFIFVLSPLISDHYVYCFQQFLIKNTLWDGQLKKR